MAIKRNFNEGFMENVFDSFFRLETRDDLGVVKVMKIDIRKKFDIEFMNLEEKEYEVNLSEIVKKDKKYYIYDENNKELVKIDAFDDYVMIVRGLDNGSKSLYFRCEDKHLLLI